MRVLLVLLLLYTTALAAAGEKVIRMGYRTTTKQPYIAAAPDSSGLYLDLYGEACRRIGYELNVIRMPKKRVLLALEKGTIDFYPGFSFNDDRARYAIWLRNGMKQFDVAITRDDHADLKTVDDLKGLRYLVALGNPDYFENMPQPDITQLAVAELDVKRAIAMILLGRADVYIYENDTMRHYLKANGISGIKFHPELIDRFYWMKAGFSRLSPLYRGTPNPAYDSTATLSATNFPHLPAEGSPVALFGAALLEMAEEGFTDSLYRHYFE